MTDDQRPYCSQVVGCQHVQLLTQRTLDKFDEGQRTMEGLARQIDRHIETQEKSQEATVARIAALERTMIKWGAWLTAAWGLIGLAVQLISK